MCQGAQADMHTWGQTNLCCRHLHLNAVLRFTCFGGYNFICLGPNKLSHVSHSGLAFICITPDPLSKWLKNWEIHGTVKVYWLACRVQQEEAALVLNADWMRIMSNSPVLPWSHFHPSFPAVFVQDSPFGWSCLVCLQPVAQQGSDLSGECWLLPQ